MKKNKLYTANKWNRALFADVDREHQNVFDGWTGSYISPSDTNIRLTTAEPFPEWHNYLETVAPFSPSLDKDFGSIQGSIKPLDIDTSMPEGLSKVPKSNWFKDNADGLVSAVAPMVGTGVNAVISGGLSSGAGTTVNTLANIGAQFAPDPLTKGLVTVGGGILSGIANAAIGTSTDEAQKAANDAGTASYNNFNSQASYFDDVKDPVAQANVVDAHKSGFLNKGWARERNEAQRLARIDARQSAFRSIDNNVYNIADDQFNNALYNITAYGGPLETDNNTNDMGYFGIYRNPDTWFALGGDLQTHGSDWSTGATYINAGGSHEENPYDGVQMGVDQEGTPNLVEEGEVIYNDYVYSNRITLDEEAKKAFHFPKKKEITYAEAAKKLEKEISERPNDPLSQAGFKAQMEALAEHQERQKQEMEAQRAQEAFAALSPEEQTAIMQQVGQQQAQEQTMQEQAMQQQAMAQQVVYPEEQMAPQYSPEEMAMMQQQIAAQGTPEGYAYGGNLFSLGGDLREWLERNHPEYNSTPQIQGQILKALEAAVRKNKNGTNARKVRRNGKIVEEITYNPNVVSNVYTSIMNGSGNTLSPRDYVKNNWGASAGDIGSRRRKHFQELVDLGMAKNVAFGIAFPEERMEDYRGGTIGRNGAEYVYDEDAGYSYNDTKYRQAVRYRDALYKELVGAKPTRATTQKVQPKSKQSQSTPGAVNKTMATSQAVQQETPSTQRTYNTKSFIPTPKDAVNAAVQAIAAQQSQGLGADAEELVVEMPKNNGETGNIQNTGYSGGSGYSENTGVVSTPARSSGWNPYAYSKDWTGFDYFNPETQQYDEGYLNFAKNINQDWVDKILAGNYGSMAKYLDRNKGYAITPEEVAYLATDKKYSDMHKAVAAAYQDYLKEQPENAESPIYNYLLDDEGNTTFLTNDEITEDLQSLPSGDPRVRYFKKNNSTASPKTYHQLEGTDGYLPEDQTTWGENVGFITGREKLDNGDTVIYHANNSIGTKTAGTSDDDSENPKPGYKAEWPRYAGIFGPAVGLGMQALGLGKPDTGVYDAIVQQSANPTLADAKYLGDYAKYTPFDRLFYANQLGASARATDRALLNSSSPNRNAGLIANGYNTNLELANLDKVGNDYNNALYQWAKGFNRGTNQFNAETFNRLSQFNADALNRNSQFRGQLAMEAAGRKENARNAWWNGIYGNLSGLFKGLSDIGRENAQWNMISDMWKDGLAGTATSETNSARGHLKDDEEKKSKGGKINKRRGFTF